MAKELTPAAHLEAFLDFIAQCESRHALACGNVSQEDKRLQDLLHEIELAPSKADCNRSAGKLRESRRIRRENKDQVVRFFEDQANRRTLNQMKQLLGRQRREEEYLFGEREYKPRVK